MPEQFVETETVHDNISALMLQRKRANEAAEALTAAMASAKEAHAAHVEQMKKSDGFLSRLEKAKPPA